MDLSEVTYDKQTPTDSLTKISPASNCLLLIIIGSLIEISVRNMMYVRKA